MSETPLNLRFGPDTRFELNPTPPPANYRETAETELDRLKRRLLLAALANETNPAINALYRRAANTATTLAEVSGFPLLVFPTLLDEMTTRAKREFERARRIAAYAHAPVYAEAVA